VELQRWAAPEGAIHNAALSVCLKAYPDTKRHASWNRSRNPSWNTNRTSTSVIAELPLRVVREALRWAIDIA